jgi:DeoR family transcriptional regulator of aga operon/DeoR family fructose operon transcriptional repressor
LDFDSVIIQSRTATSQTEDEVTGGTRTSAADPFARERRNSISRLVDERQRVRVTDLAGVFGVSAVTIRKDLLALEHEGRVARTHGGAIALEASREEGPFDIRERLQEAEKRAIGAIAARMVIDGESIALDASTTALSVARHLKERGQWDRLTVITNGLRIAVELAGTPGITVVTPGGTVRWEAMSVVRGSDVFDRFNVQKAFVGAVGFTIDVGLSDATDEEAEVKRSMVSGAREVVAIVDHTKWGRVAFATFCPTDRISAVITDSKAPFEMVAVLRARGVRVQGIRGDMASNLPEGNGDAGHGHR